MKIIIVGCGKVGVSLAERLSAEGHDLVMVDMNPQKVEHLSNQFDALGIVGNGASFNIQQEAGVENADLFIAVTGEDELNLLCCLMAKKTGHCDTIARVRNPLYNKEIRFIQESYEKIHVQCVHNTQDSTRTKEEAQKELETALQAKFKHPFELEFEWMQVIPPDPNGKLRMIVCNVN